MLPLVAAKQEAFEESIKLKNQFRNLDEDEIDFLDSVLESTRQKEEAVKKETSEQLDLFRRQQEEADKVLLEDGGEKEGVDGGEAVESGESQWAVNNRKRKRVKEKEVLKGVKLRKSSTSEAPTGLRRESQELGKKTATTDLKDNAKSSITSKASEDSTEDASNEATGSRTVVSPVITAKASTPEKHNSPKAAAAPGLGLGGYSSDEEG